MKASRLRSRYLGVLLLAATPYFIAPVYAATCSGENCVVFVTASMRSASSIGGFSGADKWCQTDANTYHYDLVSKGYTFKALLGFNHATKYGVEYYRINNDKTKSKIAIATGPNLDRYLVNSIVQKPDTGSYDWRVWTGIHDGVTSSNCGNWGSNDGTGYYADASVLSANPSIVGYGWDVYDAASCSTPMRMACVTQ